MTYTKKEYIVPYVYSPKTMIHIKKFDDLIYVYNNHKRMAYATNHLSDRGLGFGSWIRKRLIGNIDLSQSNDAICESINRINDVNWMRQKPILIRNEVINNIKQREENLKARYEINNDEQRFVDFLHDRKLDLYYKVSEFTHHQDTISNAGCSGQQDASCAAGCSVPQDTSSDGSSSGQLDSASDSSSSVQLEVPSDSERSYKSTNTCFKPIERSIPLYPFYEGLDIRFLYHRLYLHSMLHFYNSDNVAKHLFRDRYQNNPYHFNDNRISMHNDAVNYMQDFLDCCAKMHSERIADPTIPMHRLQTKTTLIFHKTSAGEYIMIFGNILALVQFGFGDPTMVSATLYDSHIFHHSLIHDDVFKLFVNNLPFGLFFPSVEHIFDYLPEVNQSLSSYTNILKTLLPWHTEQPPCIYHDVAYPIMDAVQNNTQFDPNVPNVNIPPEMNPHHPDFDQNPDWKKNIQWGKVFAGIGIICAGIGCVATGCSIPFDVTSIFRGN